MNLTINGIDEILSKLNYIQKGAIPLAQELAIKEASDYLIEVAQESLQKYVYRREEGPYQGIERGPFSDPLSGDLLVAFEADVNGLVSTIYHRSKSGLFLELGTEGHEVPDEGEDTLMSWLDPWDGTPLFSKSHYISGVMATHWFEEALKVAIPGIMEIFKRNMQYTLKLVTK